MTQSRRWQLSLLFIGLLVLISACNGDDKLESNGNADNASSESIADNNAATSTTEATPLPLTPSGVPTITSIPQSSPTPTLSYDSWRVAGEWSINFRYTIANGGPFAEVDEWVYSGPATILIEENGNVTGSGVLYPAPYDERCLVTALDSEGYPFSVNGSLGFDGEHILMNITMSATDYFVVEDYTVLCPEYQTERNVQSNFLWPALSQIDHLSYTFWMDQSTFNIDFSEDLAARTNQVLAGLLHGELLLQR